MAKNKPTMAQAFAKAKSTAKPKEAQNAGQWIAVGSKGAIKWFAEGGVSGNKKVKTKVNAQTPVTTAAKKPLYISDPDNPNNPKNKPVVKTATKPLYISDPDNPDNPKNKKVVAVVKPVVAVVAAAKAVAKPYSKLKQAPREASRRQFVQAQLKRLGINPSAAGKPRSAKEKAARVKARATWDKKNPFVSKSGPSNIEQPKTP